MTRLDVSKENIVRFPEPVQASIESKPVRIVGVNGSQTRFVIHRDVREGDLLVPKDTVTVDSSMLAQLKAMLCRALEIVNH